MARSIPENRIYGSDQSSLGSLGESIVRSLSLEGQKKSLDFLCELIKIPSTRGFEGDAARMAHARFLEVGDKCELVPIDDSIMEDPDYDFPLPDFSYADTPQVEVRIKGSGGGKTIVFNTHLDVVPPSEGQENPFSPYEKEGRIYGRGSVDAKGQVATLYALALLLREKGWQPKGDLLFHLVVEEENGGNGTLAMVRRGVEADAAIVLEPSELKVIAAVRGAMWFQLRIFGRATHSGNVQGRVSAVDKAYVAIHALREYHDNLLAASRHLPLFDVYPDPMPLTIGQFDAGTWPATVPAEAVLKGLIGFLPNKTRLEVQHELEQAIRECGDEWLRDNFEITFPMLRNDGNALPADHPLVSAMCASVERMGQEAVVDAMRAACDAWQYANVVGIPTLVFGPGSLGVAHSADEHIAVEEIFTAADILADFVMNYS
jgi:acetylornithine deacetylase